MGGRRPQERAAPLSATVEIRWRRPAHSGEPWSITHHGSWAESLKIGYVA